jgi:hypothetical protein
MVEQNEQWEHHIEYIRAWASVDKETFLKQFYP